MKIIWRDIELKTHEIDLTHAVDVKINGVALELSGGKGIRISTDSPIRIRPMASNSIIVSQDD